MNKALTCQMCKVTINEVDNTLVCDACERGYHLRCLQCNPKSIPKGEWQEWHCAKCLAISNGKPLPPKYGRVMRNISTPKLSSSSDAVQPSLDKKLHLTTNVNSVSQSESKLTEMLLNENQESGTDNLAERSNEAEFTIVSESQPPAILESVLMESQNNNLLSNVSEVSSNGAIMEDGHVKISEICIVVGEHEGPSLSSMHEVEWVGGVLKEIDGKTYYESCCINGTVYKVKDYALFSSPDNKYLPNKLQAMWEDGNTTKKCVTVTRCFFPDDLPQGVGRTCAPETNEVYESNHETTLAAGLIHDTCEVLPPSTFSKESVVQTRLRKRGSDRPKPLFLCKWFYDETKPLFRDVSC